MSRRPFLVLSLLLPLLAALPPTPAVARSAPNLKVATVTLGASRVAAFGSFTVKDTVVRSGKVPGGRHVEYVLSTDARRGGSDVPLLGVRAVPRGAGRDTVTTRLTTYGLTPPGSYLVLACADPGGDLEESSEKDNCAATSTRLEVTAAPTVGHHDVTTRLAGGRREDLELFLHDVDRFGTEAGEATATGPDGTTYTLSVPEDAGLMSLPITLTPVASVSGLPGSPRVMGVKIEPEFDLARGATLTIRPGTPLAERRALPAAYDGDGSAVRLTPMTSRPGVFTFHLTHLGGVLLIEGTAPSSRAAARRAGGMSLGELFSWTPSGITQMNQAAIQLFLAFQRQRALLGADDDAGTFSGEAVRNIVDSYIESAHAEIEDTDAHPTIGQWDGLLRFLTGVQRQFQLLGAGEYADERFASLLPLLAPVFQKVRDGVHACDDGMGDVVATVELRASGDVNGALFGLPPDTSTACTRLRAHVDYVEHLSVDDEFQPTSDYTAAITWQPKDVLDYGNQDEQATYTDYSFHDACEHGEGPLTPEVPWTLYGIGVDWDSLYQRWTGEAWQNPEKTPFGLQAHLGSVSQAGVLDDPGCDEAEGTTYGPDRSPAMALVYQDGVLAGELVEDESDDGLTRHVEIRYDVTAVP